MYNLDPYGTVAYNGVKVPVILDHATSCALGLGSAHGDIQHWFKKFGKTLDDVRKDVYNLLHPIVEEEDEDMTQEKFNEMMNNWVEEQANKQPYGWSAENREWAEKNGLINGDEKGRKMYRKFITREELVAVLHRFAQKGL